VRATSATLRLVGVRGGFVDSELRPGHIQRGASTEAAAEAGLRDERCGECSRLVDADLP